MADEYRPKKSNDSTIPADQQTLAEPTGSGDDGSSDPPPDLPPGPDESGQ